MARCNACGNPGVRQEDVLLARNRNGRWVTLCRDCQARGVQPDDLNPMGPVTGARGPAGQPAADDPFGQVPKALAILRAASAAPSPHDSGNLRVHPRHEMRISLPFRLMRDDVVNEAQLHDISEGGLRLVVRRELARGQLIQFDHQGLPLPPALLAMLKETAEVRRVVPYAGGGYEVGLRFVQRGLAKGANRRRHRRYLCAMAAFYQRPESVVTEFGRVEDLSQGGLQMRSDEPLDSSERLSFYLRGDSGPFVKNDLVGIMEVRRVIPRGAEYEIGCQFVETRVAPRVAVAVEAPAMVAAAVSL